ncbi:hypothetical protein SCHPADRAFT_621753 [Schizopora paradoxa]|uniref:Uncharacterized protein n=1 Tax=Schizopora paradoxa TaxID=27342 RepID=A0A0H2R9Q9_9AGAM|nr:hypothetical protein SCHPADRAFT_621753 [Schizopora paradoxa]
MRTRIDDGSEDHPLPSPPGMIYCVGHFSKGVCAKLRSCYASIVKVGESLAHHQQQHGVASRISGGERRRFFLRHEAQLSNALTNGSHSLALRSTLFGILRLPRR